MFRGKYIHTLDGKGRVSIPARFRRLFPADSEKDLVLTQGIGSCIDLYTMDQWRSVEGRMTDRLDMYTRADLRFLRMMLQNNFDVEMDGQSRILIPQGLLEYARIENEVLILGMLNKIELWNPAVYDAYMKESPKSFEEIAEEVMSRGSGNPHSGSGQGVS